MRTALYSTAKPKPPERATLTIAETAAQLGVSPETVRTQIHNNTLPFPWIKIGRRYLIGRAAVDAALDGRASA